MLRNTTIDKQPFSGKPGRVTGRWKAKLTALTALATAIVLASAPLTAGKARAAAPPPVPVVAGRVLPAPDSPGLRAGTAGPGFLLPQAAPVMRGTALPVPRRAGPAGGDGGGDGGGGGSVHIVRAGESLWAVALLHAGAGDRRSAQAMFEAILRANRDRFGTGGPDLIFPGERLLIPSYESYGSSSHG